MKVVNTLFGESIIIDRRNAGDCAQESGALFENIVYNDLLNYNISIIKQHDFYCHYGMPRRGDFLIKTNDSQIHIECKQLGNVQSHFDKLDHCFMNLIRGCYGKHFWLVYDFAKDSTNGAYKKIYLLKEEAEQIKKQVALQGITFALVHIEDIPALMRSYNIQKKC